MTDINEAFRYWRQRGTRAAVALQRARDDVAANTPRFGGKPDSTYGWSNGSQATRAEYGSLHIPDLAAAGLRLVGYCDELTRIDHTGWFVDEDQNDKMRGVVLQLPARDGRAQYLAGYEDPYGNGYVLELPKHGRAIIPGECKGGAGEDGPTYSSDAKEAARAADAFAEREADEARDYNAAWRAGSDFAAKGEEIAEARKEALAILAERRKVQGVDAPALCKAIRARVESLLETIADARRDREALAESVWSDKLTAAFNDGAGIVQAGRF